MKNEELLNDIDALLKKYNVGDETTLMYIKNIVSYGTKIDVDCITYPDAKKRFPNIREWNGIPVSYLDDLCEYHLIPIRIESRSIDDIIFTYLVCEDEDGHRGYLDISNDEYTQAFVDHSFFNIDVMTDTYFRWKKFICKWLFSVRAIELHWMYEHASVEDREDPIFEDVIKNYNEASEFFRIGSNE